MTIYQWLCLLGIPAIITGLLKFIFGLIKKQAQEIEGVKLGVQALLRAQMISEYNKWHEEKGYAPIYAKENFENCWTQYHSLGVNGVMDDIHERFLALPTEPPENKGGTYHEKVLEP